MLTDLSQQRLATCHPDLQRLVDTVAVQIPLLVICGYRDQAAQEAAFHDGKSKLQWPNSKHNPLPSLAVDLAPMPLDWNDLQSFVRLAATVKATALALGIAIEWGGDWDRFKDLDHFQLVTP